MGVIEFRREYDIGEYVTTADGLTAMIIDDNGMHGKDKLYEIALCEREEERSVSANEIRLWVPDPGGPSEPVWV